MPGRQAHEWCLSSQKKALLRAHFKMTLVDVESVEDARNFPKAPGVITWIRDTGRGLNVWVHLWAKEAFPAIRMAEVGSLDLKKLQKFCTKRVSGYSPSHIIQGSKPNISHGCWRHCPGWLHDDRDGNREPRTIRHLFCIRGPTGQRCCLAGWLWPILL